MPFVLIDVANRKIQPRFVSTGSGTAIAKDNSFMKNVDETISVGGILISKNILHTSVPHEEAMPSGPFHERSKYPHKSKVNRIWKP